MITDVVLTQKARKQLRRVPEHIVTKLLGWITAVELGGVAEVRKSPGYHDEPLQGDRQGQRSIRLSKAYRAIYEVKKDGGGHQGVELIEVQEVHKHRY